VQTESVTLSGLAAGTTYHFRLEATNAAGTTDGADQTLTTAPSPPAPPATITEELTVWRAGTGGGRVTSSPIGISCGLFCSRLFTAGTSVTLTARPASGSRFTGWRGACSGTGACTVSMTARRTVTAGFAEGALACSARAPAVAKRSTSRRRRRPATYGHLRRTPRTAAVALACGRAARR
jgi:hypothetical protein